MGKSNREYFEELLQRVESEVEVCVKHARRLRKIVYALRRCIELESPKGSSRASE